jgi:Gram-negative bacterial TonB protein C-terminal
MTLFRQCCLVFALWATTVTLGAQQLTDVIPPVLVRTNPIYPPIARTAHIQGDVRVKVTTDGSSVVNAEMESGPPLLQKNTLDSVRTWKFASNTPATFSLLFRFRLMEANQVTFQESPGVVQIVGQLPPMGVTYSSVEMGEWQAQIITRTGVLRKTMRMSRTGIDGLWLDVTTKDAAASCPRFSNSGRLEGQFVVFVMNDASVGDASFLTSFTGRMIDDKIVGVFLDQEGRTGTWSAKRVAKQRTDADVYPIQCYKGSVE